ncbi:MAG: hypothetical protein AAF845_04305 [Bacteroidota bacterium]
MANPLTRLFLDPVDAERNVPDRYRLRGDHRWWSVPMAVGVLMLVAAVAGGLASIGLQATLFAYLIGWVFCVSVAIGALFFVMIQHITKARWSTTIRRIPEALAASFPLLAVLGIPVLLGMHDLFHWTHAELFDPESPYYDYLVAGKAPYLNVPFFLVRYVLYFVAFSYVGHKLYSLSVRNDANPDPQNTLDLRRWSAIGIPVCAVFTSFAAYDFVMSTDPHWFSTMFGIYFFAGGWLTAICLTTMLALWFKKAGMLPEVTVEHQQDMGKFMFAFTVFWTYVAFSQYMLYWYANIPEETVWFAKRFTGGWETVSWALLIFHFILPFFILLPRATKRVAPALAIMAGWLIVMHWVDLWWMTMPSMYVSEASYGAEQAASVLASGDRLASLAALAPEGAEPGIHVVAPNVPLAEMAMWIGLFGVYVGTTMIRLGRHALTPYGDPYFADSLRFENT